MVPQTITEVHFRTTHSAHVTINCSVVRETMTLRDPPGLRQLPVPEPRSCREDCLSEVVELILSPPHRPYREGGDRQAGLEKAQLPSAALDDLFAALSL